VTALVATLVATGPAGAAGKKVAKPQGLHVAAATPTSVTLGWAPVPNASAYRVQFGKKRDMPMAVTATEPTVTLIDLKPGSRYFATVRAVGPNGKRTGKPAKPIRFRTPQTSAVPVAPGAAPTGLRVVEATHMAVTLDWDDTAGATSYLLRISAQPDMAGATEMGYTASTASVRGLPQGTNYHAQVLAVDAAVQPVGGWSPVVPLASPSVPPPPPVAEVLTVASFNVRCANCYKQQNGEKPWEKRRPAVIAQIISRKPDVIGVQEASQAPLKGTKRPQFADLRRGLRAAGVPYEVTNTAQYNCVNSTIPKNCTPRDNGASQGTRVFYNSDTVELVQAGSKLLPSAPGQNNRYMAWAMLKKKSTGKQFFFATVHTQYMAKYAALRHQEVQVMMDEVAARNPGLPAFVTGDFNSTRYQSPTNAPYDEVIARGFVDPLGHTAKSPEVSSASTAEVRIRANYNSHNNFLRTVSRFADWQNGSNLDYIFTTPMRVLGWETVIDLDANNRIVGVIPSDHNMIGIKAVLP
jgi:endonuclease/exonuclease/phosphatase family metal-dependent hydrolase